MGSSNEDEYDELKNFTLRTAKELTELGTKLKLKSYKIKLKLDSADESNIGELTLNLAKCLTAFKLNIDRLVQTFERNVRAVNKKVNSAEISESISVLEELKQFCNCYSSLGVDNVVNNKKSSKDIEVPQENIRDTVIFDEIPENNNEQICIQKKSNLSLQKTDTQDTNDSWEDTLSRPMKSNSDLLNGFKYEIKEENVDNVVTSVNTNGGQIYNEVESKRENNDTSQDDRPTRSKSSDLVPAGPPSPHTLRMMYVDKDDGASVDISDDNSSTVHNSADTVSRDSSDSSNSGGVEGDSAIESDDRSMSECNAVREYVESVTETAGESLDCAEELPYDENIERNENVDIAIESNDNVIDESDVEQENVDVDVRNIENNCAGTTEIVTENENNVDMMENNLGHEHVENDIENENNVCITENNEDVENSETVNEEENIDKNSENDSETTEIETEYENVENNSKNDSQTTGNKNCIMESNPEIENFDDAASKSDSETTEILTGIENDVDMIENNLQNEIEPEYENIEDNSKNDSRTTENENCMIESIPEIENFVVAASRSDSETTEILTGIENNVDMIENNLQNEIETEFENAENNRKHDSQTTENENYIIGSNPENDNFDVAASKSDSETTEILTGIENNVDLIKKNLQNEMAEGILTQDENKVDEDIDSASIHSALTEKNNRMPENNQKNDKSGSLDSQGSSVNMTIQEIEAYVAREVAWELEEIDNEKNVQDAEKRVDVLLNGACDEGGSATDSGDGTTNLQYFDRELDRALSLPLLKDTSQLVRPADLKEIDKELEELLANTGAVENEQDNDNEDEKSSSEECATPNETSTGNNFDNKDIQNDSEHIVDQDFTGVTQSQEDDTKLPLSGSTTTLEDNRNENDLEIVEEDRGSESSYVFDIRHDEIISQGDQNGDPDLHAASTETIYSENDRDDGLGDVFSESVIDHTFSIDTTIEGESEVKVKCEVKMKELVVLVQDVNKNGDLEIPDVKPEICPRIKEEFTQVIDMYMKDKPTQDNQLTGDDRDELLRMLDCHINSRSECTLDVKSEGEDEDDSFNEAADRAATNRLLLEELLDDYFKRQDGNNGENNDNDPSEGSITDPLSSPVVDTALMDVMKVEVVTEEDLNPYKNNKRKSDVALADEIAKAWMEGVEDSLPGSDFEEARSGRVSSNISDIDIDRSDLDVVSDTSPTGGESADENPPHVKVEPDSDSDDRPAVHIRDLTVKLERLNANGSDIPNTLPQRKRRKSATTSDSDIDRLCDISTVDGPRRRRLSRSARKRLRLKRAKARRSGSSSSSTSTGSSLELSGDDEPGWSDPDDLGVAPLEPDDEDDERRMADALLDTIADTASEGGYESDTDEGKERKPKKEDELLPRRKKRKRSQWEYDSLLRGRLSSDESDNSAKRNSSWIDEKLLAKKPKITSDNSNDSDVTVINDDAIKTEIETPKKVLFNLSDNSFSDSEVEFVMDKRRTPKKIQSSQGEEDAENADSDEESRKRGRRNIRSLLSDEKLAESTQKANREEEERIARLEEKKKLTETFSQSMGSQISVDDRLVLDFDKETSDPLVTVHPKLTKRLKPHQRKGVEFMWDSCYESVKRLKKSKGSGCILAHCMGLGKTFQALTLIHTLFTHEVTNTKHVLVVCPLSTVSNWKNEFDIAFRKIKKCDIRLFTLGDKKNTSLACKADIVKKWRRKTGMLVMGYEAFGIMTNEQKLDKTVSPKKKSCILEALVNPGPDLVICDEGHLLKNKLTQRTLALNKVNTERRIVLTGTPLQNNLTEYYHMVHFVKPNLLGTEKEFKTNFVNPISNGQYEDSTYGDIKLMKKRTHILHRVLERTVQRVEDNELEVYLPKRVDYAVFVQLSPLQARMYNAYMGRAESLREGGGGPAGNRCFLTDVQMVKYISTHPHVLDVADRLSSRKIREKDVIDDDREMMGRVEPGAVHGAVWRDLQPADVGAVVEYGHKLSVVRHIIEESEAVDDKVLIFSQSIAEMDTIEHFLHKCGTARCPSWKSKVDYYRMDGTIPPEERTRMCNKFNSKHNKSIRVFIMSTKVGGLGLNLTAANRVIIMTVNWNPSYDTQSVFRAYRFGQDKTVFIYRLIAIDTMEEKIYQRQVTKLAIAHRVVDRHQITRHYSSMDLEELYSLRPQADKERPLPMVPEDKILAKLIQRLPCVFKWHEHRALLANRPEEDLNEDEKKDAWEEFTKREKEPPQMPPTANPSMMPQFPQPQFVTAGSLVLPSTSSDSYNNSYRLKEEHSYSLPRRIVFNPALQRTDPVSNFNMQFRPAIYPNNVYVSNNAPPKTTTVNYGMTTSGPTVTIIGPAPAAAAAAPTPETVIVVGGSEKPSAGAQGVGEGAAVGQNAATTSQNAATSAGGRKQVIRRHLVTVPGVAQAAMAVAPEVQKDPLEIPETRVGTFGGRPMLCRALVDLQEKLAEAKKARNSRPRTFPSKHVVLSVPPNAKPTPKVLIRNPVAKVHRSQNGAVSKPNSPKPIDLTTKKVSMQTVKLPSPLPSASIHSRSSKNGMRVFAPPIEGRAKRNLVFANATDKENKSKGTGWQANAKSDLAKRMTEKFKQKLKNSGVTMEEHVNLVDDESDVVSDTTSGSGASLNTEIIKNLTMNGVSINKVGEKSGGKVITLE